MKKQRDIIEIFKSGLQRHGISTSTARMFRSIIYDHYRTNRREMPWRKTRDPYRILVSEVMLQQTQVERVLDKYRDFLAAFPSFKSLANAPLSSVLSVWQGMGYNRRAISLKKTAEIVTEEFKGKLPSDAAALKELPGIGPYTASAIHTFVTNSPSLFIETNIRRVYIHFFFDDRGNIGDDEIMPIIDKTLDRMNPRDWYYALMDYGVKLKKEVKNPNRRSAHYQKQPAFHGSVRQLRGMILKALLQSRGLTPHALRKKLPRVPDNIDQILEGLIKEGFMRRSGNKLVIS